MTGEVGTGVAGEPPPGILEEAEAAFGPEVGPRQATVDQIPTIWAAPRAAAGLLRFLKQEVPRPFRMLYDLSVVDERVRSRREGQPPADASVTYHLLSLDRNQDLRVKVPLSGPSPSLPSVTPIWPSAAWYEREAWDMFGVAFEGHPDPRRILMPDWWEGHPLRKDHYSRATDAPAYRLDDAQARREERELARPARDRRRKGAPRGTDLLTINLGPHHPGTHGLLRLVATLRGEEIVDLSPDIGFHHRGAEKMGERQTWHTFIPYTDRVDYLGGALNNLPYLLAVERMAGIAVPERAQVIRVMLCELYRLSNHLVWYGTMAQDVGALSPVFYTFNARERVLEVAEAITGGRLHPGWFRIGGVAQDLPAGWDRLVRSLLDHLPERLAEFDRLILRNALFRSRTRGVGAYDAATAVEWGVTGPGLRACGVEWDWRKKRPYSGYDRFEFEVPTGVAGDCFDRSVVRVEEMRQSLRIVEQCLKGMPGGPVKADHPLAVPPPRDRTLRDIETLIQHFLAVSWGPVIPPGESFAAVEAARGSNGYYLVSDGGGSPYRVRIRTPSFPHLQMLPLLARGRLLPDLLAILGSIDYVMADVDR